MEQSEFRKHRQRAGGGKREAQSLMLGQLIGSVIERHPSLSAAPVADWKELVGEQVARYCQPRSLKQKVLIVTAYDSVWKHHLELNKEALVEKINLGRPEPLVERIVVRVGELLEGAPRLDPEHSIPAQRKTGRGREKKKKRKTPARRLTPEEQILLKGLSDPDLRAIGARLLKRVPLESDA